MTCYKFSSCVLDTDRHELIVDGQAQQVEPQVFALLDFLIANRSRVVSRDEIIDSVWEGRIVSDEALSSRISAARKAVGDDGHSQAIIRTVPRRGFRFVSKVDKVQQEDELEGPEEPTVPAPIDRVVHPSIAVLPFDNLSGDPEQEYFSDGITEDIITALSKFRWFFVISRNSSFAFKGKSVDVKSVAHELGVRYVLEGSVRKADNRLRINAKLVDATVGNHVWAERFDRELFDIFALQDEITEAIAATVAPELVSAEIRRARRLDRLSLDAWDCTMRASFHHARCTEQDAIESDRFLRQAIELDSDQGHAFCLMAFNHLMRAQFGWSESATQSIQDAMAAAQTAVELDDRDAWAHTALGLVDLISRRFDQAVSRLKSAVALNGNLANAQGGLGQALALGGDYNGAVESIEKAIRLSPLDPYTVYWFGHLGLAAFAAERYDVAIQWAEKAIQQNSSFPGGYRLLAASQGQSGLIGEARLSFEKLNLLMPRMTVDDVRRQVPYKNPAVMDRYVAGLCAAGLADRAQ